VHDRRGFPKIEPGVIVELIEVSAGSVRIARGEFAAGRHSRCSRGAVGDDGN